MSGGLTARKFKPATTNVSRIPRRDLEAASTSRSRKIHLQVDLTMGDVSRLSSIGPLATKSAFDSRNLPLGVTNAPSDFGKLLARHASIASGRQMPDDLGSGANVGSPAYVVEPTQLPLSTDLAGSISAKSSHGVRPSEGHSEVAVDLGPEPVSRRS
jgi:hypothetical protein